MASALGFLSGFQDGMQSTLGLLDALDVRQRREQQAMQQQVTFNNQQEAYNYDKNILRPLRENEARYRLQDLESSIKYNKEYRPLSLDILRGDKKWKENERNYILKVERPQEERVAQLKYDTAKTDFDTAKLDNERKQQERNMNRALQLYTAAGHLEKSNPQEAQRLMFEADDLSGGVFSNAANGVNSRMYQQAQEVVAGQRELDDPEFLATSREAFKPTLLTTRNGKFEFSHFEPLPDGRISYQLSPQYGGKYRESINKSANEFGVDPLLSAAVISVESAGNPSARSPKNALGLMQVMPKTGIETAQRIGMEQFDPMNSDENIRVGTAYLGEQLKKYKGNPGIALAAYNAGPGAVDKYGGIPPYKETQAYVQKVLAEYERLKRTVPATKNRSSDPNDVIVADTTEQAMAKIQQGVALEQSMSQGLKEALQTRKTVTQALLGVKPDSEPRGKDRYMEVNDRVFDVVSQQFVTDKAADGEKLVKVGRDESLYDPATGQWVSPSGANAKGQSALSSFTKAFGDDPETAKASLVDQQFPELGTEKKASILSQLSEAQTPDEVFSALQPIRIDQDASAWASDLAQGIDPELVKSNPQAAAISQLSNRAKALGLAEGDIKEIALEVLQLPGVANNPQAQIQLMAEKLKIAELERKAEERYQRKQQAAADLPKESMPVGSPLSVFGE